LIYHNYKVALLEPCIHILYDLDKQPSKIRKLQSKNLLLPCTNISRNTLKWLFPESFKMPFFEGHHKNKILGLCLLGYFCNLFGWEIDDENNFHMVYFHSTNLTDMWLFPFSRIRDLLMISSPYWQGKLMLDKTAYKP